MRQYQNLYAIHHSDGLPSQLTFDFPIQGRDMVRIIENERRRFEANLVFSLVCTVLPLVPCELQNAALSGQICIGSVARYGSRIQPGV